MSSERKKAFEVKWRIENIKPWIQTKNNSLYSPSFLAKSIMSTRWKLKLTRICQKDENCISLTLQRYIDDYSEPIALNCELSVLACDESPLKSKTCTMKFAPKTLSKELILTGVEILGEKIEAYFPQSVLTVCCKLWMPWNTISKGQCSMRSLIGRKCITLDGTIDNFASFVFNSNVTVNFMSPFEEIYSISFDVSRTPNRGMWFERTEVQCKCFSSYSCKLFALKSERGRTECVSSSRLAKLLTSHKSCAFEMHFMQGSFNWPAHLKNDTLTLQLEITCYPAVESEYIEYDDNNYYKTLTEESSDLEKVNPSNLEIEHDNQIDCLHLSENEEKPGDIEENEFSDAGEGFGAAAKRDLPLTTLKKDLTSLYNDGLFCDTKLRTDTETFPVHRNILCARSPVFKKMFMTDMKENAGECINVPDISPDTARRMLKFLYTDCVGDLEMQVAKDLYIASDKYDIVSLKQHCSSFMKENLCPANVCDVLVLADMHQDKDLEAAAQKYALTNDEKVFYSDEWKLFMKNCGCLAAQVMYLKWMKK